MMCARNINHTQNHCIRLNRIKEKHDIDEEQRSTNIYSLIHGVKLYYSSRFSYLVVLLINL